MKQFNFFTLCMYALVCHNYAMQTENEPLKLSELKQPLSLKEHCIDAVITKLDDISENTLAILPTELKDEIYYTLRTNVEQKLYPLTVDSEKINIAKIIQPYPTNINDFIKIDDNKIALGLEDNTIRIMQLMPFQELMVLNGHTILITALAKIDNNTIASGSADNTINIWDLEKKQAIRKLTGATQRIQKLIKINSSTIAARSFKNCYHSSNNITIWDIKSGDKIKLIDILVGTQVIALNSHSIAYSNADTIEIYNLKTDTKQSIHLPSAHSIFALKRLNEHTIAFNSWSDRLATYNINDNTIKKIAASEKFIDIIKKIDTEKLLLTCDSAIPFDCNIYELETSKLLVTLTGKIGLSIKFKKYGNFFLSYESTTESTTNENKRKNTIFLWDLRPLLLKKYTLPMLQEAYRLLCKKKSTKEECINAMVLEFEKIDTSLNLTKR